MTRYLGYCALALLTVLPTASVYSAVQNDTMGLYAPNPSYIPDIQNSAPATPPPGDDSLYSDDVPDSSTAPDNAITPLNSFDVMSFSIGPVSLRMTASEAITAITDKLGQSAGEEIQKRYSNNSLNSIFWGDAHQETVVYFIPDTAVDPIEPVAYKIRFSFSNPDLLLKSAIEKYGVPSVSDVQSGRYIWCKALAEKTNKCDDSKSELTLTTREVEDTGILTLSDPTVSFDASRTATATPDKDQSAAEDNQGPLPQL